MKQQFSTWNKATTIDTYSGPVLAAHSTGFAVTKNLYNIEYSIFFVQNNAIAKSWQYQFGEMLSPISHNHSIFYWKPLKDIDFSNIKWKDYTQLPELNSHIIGWINESDLIEEQGKIKHIALTALSCRLHFGYFIKSGLIFKSNYLYYPEYRKIPWHKLFRWCYVDELFENDKNEDARKLPINPDISVHKKFVP